MAPISGTDVDLNNVPTITTEVNGEKPGNNCGQWLHQIHNKVKHHKEGRAREESEDAWNRANQIPMFGRTLKIDFIVYESNHEIALL